MARMTTSSAASFDGSIGAKPPSSPTAVESPFLVSTFLSAWKTSTPMRSASAKVVGADRHDHELLRVDVVRGVRAAVQDVHHAARAARAPSARRGSGRAAARSRLGRGARHGQRDAEDRVGAELALVRRAVGVHHLGVDRDLIGRPSIPSSRGPSTSFTLRTASATPLPR